MTNENSLFSLGAKFAFPENIRMSLDTSVCIYARAHIEDVVLSTEDVVLPMHEGDLRTFEKRKRIFLSSVW